MKASSALLLLLLRRTAAAAVNYQPVVISSEDGNLEVTLNVDMLESLGGIRLAPAYNGEPVGPTLRAKPGDTVSVTLNNLLPPGSDLDRELFAYTNDEASDDINATIIHNRLTEYGTIGTPLYGYWGQHYVNLHCHGCRVSPSIEDVRHALDGGESKTYTFTIPEDQEAGFHWYHNHVHGITTQSYLSSLFGAFIIEGTDSDITNAPGVEGSTEVIVLLSEGYVNEDKTVPPDGIPLTGAAEKWNAVVNGQLGSETKYEFSKGETVLFRAVSATITPEISLMIPGVTFVVLAHDGLPMPEPEEVQVVDLDGGGRVEFLARFDEPGNYTMIRKAKPGRIPNFSWNSEQVLATITVNPADTDAPTDPLIDRVELPEYSDNLKALAEMESIDTKTISMQGKKEFPLFQIPQPQEEVPGRVSGYGINGRISTPTHMNGQVTAGTCETWEIVNEPSPGYHPFHIHAARMLVTHINGIELETPFWRDTMAVRGNITVHVCFDVVQLGDYFLAHCHMATHIDPGMVAMFETVAASSDSTINITQPTEAAGSSTSQPTKASSGLFSMTQPTEVADSSNVTTLPTEAAGSSTSQPTEPSSGTSNTTQPTEAAGSPNTTTLPTKVSSNTTQPSSSPKSEPTESVLDTSSGDMARRNFSLASCLFFACALGFVW